MSARSEGHKAALLVNLGSPDSPSVPEVRRYLREFLMDPRVLDVNWLLRFAIVHLAILPRRPKQSAHAYQTIWTAAGSPLVVTSRNVQRLLQERVSVPVELAMRYQNPSVPEAIRKLMARQVSDLLLIPLFPHYAMSSFETAAERVREVARELAPGMNVRVQPPYFDHPGYIRALVASAAADIGRPYDHLLFSFHGIPERHIRKSDPTGCHCLSTADCCERPGPAHEFCYRAQCFRTAREFVRHAGVPEGKWSVAFQSRLGRDPWLSPYTDQRIVELARSGARRLLVICPAFVSDCLETIEEIGMRGRETYLAAGGVEFTRIPCLNENPLWIEVLEGMVKEFTG